MGKLTLMVAVGACMLACSGDLDDAIDDTSSSEGASNDEAAPGDEAAPSETTDDERTDDDACRVDMSTPEAAQETYARLRETPSCVRVIRRGERATIDYKIN
jgi:hypothetical protein